MKKIMTLLLAFISLMNISISAGAEENKGELVDCSKYIRFVQSVGIITDESVESDKTVTRGQFADFVNNILFGSGETP